MKMADFSGPPNKFPQARKKESIIKGLQPAHRNRLQRLAREAVRSTNTRNTTGILTISGNAVAARAEAVVPSGLIGLAGIHRIPFALLVEVVLGPDRVHVGRLVDGPGAGGDP